MSTPSREQVLALAPDPSSAKAGQTQATLAKWPTCGTDGSHAWGECKGSGAKPYQVSADLTDFATACSCPSRKFPCKHGIGLLLLLAQGAVPAGEPAAWTVLWRDKRAQRGAQRAQPATPQDEQARAEAAARRVTARETKVDAGAAALQQWLEDLVRTGFATTSGQVQTGFVATAARMVDAQAKGLADRVRLMGQLMASSGADPAWSRRTLDVAGSTALLLRAWQRRDALDDDTRQQVLVRLGLPAAEPGEVVRDAWTLLGHEVSDDDRITTMRQWAIGRATGRLVTLLSFAGPGSPLAAGLADGDTDAELALHGGPLPARATLRTSFGLTADIGPPASSATWTAALEGYRALLEQDPWADRTLLACADVELLPGEPWLARDRDGHALGLAPDTGRLWRALSHSGGRPTTVAGEWDGHALRVLSVQADDGRWWVLR